MLFMNIDGIYFTLYNIIWTIIMCVKDLLDMMMKNNGGMALQY